MSELPPDLATAFARRIAERDNPTPVPLSQEPAAIQARLMAWLRTQHGVRDPRGQLRLVRMLLALMQHPERTTSELGVAAGLTERATNRTVARLAALGLTSWTYRGLYRYHRLQHATEDALLLLLAGPGARPQP